MAEVRPGGTTPALAPMLAPLALVCLLAAPAPGAAQERMVDLELVLAVDASGSVDFFEYDLQLAGIAAAMRDPQVHEAIVAGKHGAIAVALVAWAEATLPKDATDWFLVSGPAEAEVFARTVERFGRRVYGGTGIGEGIAESIRHMDRNGYLGTRQVVDVSGDGRETPPRDFVVMIDQARSMALARGVTVNGLAILNDDPDLARWYRDNLRTGESSFVVTARNHRDFAGAMLMKLIREIRHEPPVAALPASGPSALLAPPL